MNWIQNIFQTQQSRCEKCITINPTNDKNQNIYTSDLTKRAPVSKNKLKLEHMTLIDNIENFGNTHESIGKIKHDEYIDHETERNNINKIIDVFDQDNKILDVDNYDNSILDISFKTSALKKETTDVINSDNEATIPFKFENEPYYETNNKSEEDDISTKNFYTKKFNCVQSSIIDNNSFSEDEGAITNDKISNFNTLNKIKNSIDDNLIVDLNDEQDVIIDSDSDSISYHSSVFEFIEEDEASLNGLYTLERKEDRPVHIRTEDDLLPENIMLGYFNPPQTNENKTVPTGDSYVKLFQGRYAPYPLRGIQNKSDVPRPSVTKAYRRFRLHVARAAVADVSIELRKEQADTAKIICNMYPVENSQYARLTRKI